MKNSCSFNNLKRQILVNTNKKYHIQTLCYVFQTEVTISLISHMAWQSFSRRGLRKASYLQIVIKKLFLKCKNNSLIAIIIYYFSTNTSVHNITTKQCSTINTKDKISFFILLRSSGSYSIVMKSQTTQDLRAIHLHNIASVSCSLSLVNVKSSFSVMHIPAVASAVMLKSVKCK